MRQDHRFQRKGKINENQRRMLPVILIPLIVIVLMIVIVIADHSGEQDKETKERQTPAETETMASGDEDSSGGWQESAADPAATEPDSGQEEIQAELFLTEEMPGIQDLLVRYYKARAAADAETVNEIYGRTDVSASDLAAQKVRMGNNAKYISDISNVAVYVVQGAEAGSWLVYSTADIKFYTAKTPAPMIMWCYVKQDGEGNYRIVDNTALTSGELQFADQTNRSREVRALASGVNGQLREALASDEALREVYGVLHEGSPVWSDETETKDAVVILDGAGQAENGESGDAAGEGVSAAGESGESVPESGEPAGEAGEAGATAGETIPESGASAGEAGQPDQEPGVSVSRNQ